MRPVARISLRLAFAVASSIAAPPAALAQHLDHNGGRVLGHPAIHNLYFTYDWDGNAPAAINRNAINGFTQQLVNGSYFDGAGQYGVGNASYTGSDEAIVPPPVIAGVTEFLAILTWMELETAINPIPLLGVTITGIPEPDDNTLYALYIPRDVQINDIAVSTCGSFGAYHFMGDTAVWTVIYTPLPVPIPTPQSFPFAVIPTACTGTLPVFDGVTGLATHELIESATDPIILSGWVDNSTIDWNFDVLKAGEAADICESGVGSAGQDLVRMADGLLVAPYWSNAASRCVPVTHTFHLAESGLPGTVPHEATFDGGTVILPFDAIVDDATTHSYSFPSPVADPNPGIRYITSEPPATVVVTANFSRTAVYTTQYWLQVDAAPSSVQPLDASLTPSGWIDAGQTVTLTTDPLISIASDTRYRFDAWSGTFSSTSPTQAFAMNGPTTEVANYQLQYLVTVYTSGLGANVTHITNLGLLLGTANDTTPLSLFQDAGPLALGADAFVYGANAVQYFFQGFTPPAPSTLAAPFTTTAVYATMAQLIQQALGSGGIYGPGAVGVANALLQQWAAVEANLAAGRYATALNGIQAFVNLLQAQTGSHVTPALAATLELDAMLVYHATICLALGAGQLNATTAAAAYAYYSALVTSLGGTVLPAC